MTQRFIPTPHSGANSPFQSSAGIKASARFAKVPRVDIRDEFQAVQEPCGPAGAMQTIVFYRGESLTNKYKLDVARQHGIPLLDDIDA